MPREEYRLRRVRSVRRIVLRGVAVQLYRHPILAVAGLAVLTGWAAWRSADLGISTNLRASPPPEPAEQRAWNSIRTASADEEPVWAVIRFPETAPAAPPDRDRVAKRLADALLDRDYFAGAMRAEKSTDAPLGSPRLTYGQTLNLLNATDFERLAELASPEGARRALRKAAGGPAARPTSSTLPAGDPVGILRRLEARRTGEFGRQEPWPPSRTEILTLRPVRGPDDLLYCLRLGEFLKGTVEALRRAPVRPDLLGDESPRERVAGDEKEIGPRGGRPEGTGTGGFPPALPREVDVDFLGRHVETARLAAGLRGGLIQSFSILFVCFGLLMILAFRKVESLFFVGIPPCVGLVWTCGLLACFAGRISLLTAVFACLLLVLGIEYSVQIYHRFVEELYREERYYPALDVAYTEAGRGIFVSMLTMALIFFSLLLSGLPDVRELALAGGLGAVSMAAAALLILPPMAALKSRLAGGRVEPEETFDFGLGRLSAAVTSSPGACLALGLVVTVYLAFFCRRTEIDLEAGLGLATVPASSANERPDPPHAVPPTGQTISILVESDTLQGALLGNDRLYANLVGMSTVFGIRSVRSLSPVLPALATREAAMLGLEKLDLEAMEKSLQAAALSLGMSGDAFAPFMATLSGLKRAALTEAENPRHPGDHLDVATLNDLGGSSAAARVRERLVFAGGVYRVETQARIPPAPPESGSEFFEEFARQAGKGLRAGTLRFQSEGLENRRVAQKVVYSMALGLFLAVASLLICLVPHFHGRIGESLLVMTPLTVAIVWTFGLLALLERPVGSHVLLVFPLAIGVAVDQSILLIQRVHERCYATLRQVVRSGGRPGVVSGLALVLGLGCLAQTRLGSLQEMAGVALLAIAFSTLAMVILLPAFLQVLEERGSGIRSGRREEPAEGA
ncbi:MAG TPA: MMPL family transporter [Sumerlaeia bacterium]|nr:MMPL family transporter [Sumerlaeia bacterium]